MFVMVAIDHRPSEGARLAVESANIDTQLVNWLKIASRYYQYYNITLVPKATSRDLDKYRSVLLFNNGVSKRRQARVKI